MPARTSKKTSPAKTEKLRQQVAAMLPILKEAYPEARCSLNFKNPLQLLIATILSAQCTDERVNKVTPALFARYKTAADFAGAPREEIERLIQSTGFFRNKARSIQEMAAALIEKHGGEVPRTMEELTALAGVGRKTANVVLGNAFDQNIGVVVDTHVGRLSHRLGLTRHTDAVKIEHDLIKLVPREDWTLWAHLMIHHGRAVCTARKPACDECPVAQFCPSAYKLSPQS
jgi:endonuclease-3